uniref:Dynein, light chain, roadblock-type 1 n=1 Tax=Oryzias latipes TaxID=8090 RepID=A0A3P9IYG1_ORYLA
MRLYEEGGKLGTAGRLSPGPPAPGSHPPRIQSQKGVQGVIIVNSEGIPIKTTLDNTSTVQYAGLIQQLVLMARSTVRELDPQNDLTFLRVRSKKNEIMIAPDKDYFLIVIQNPSA